MIFKDIHIGSLIKQRVTELEMDQVRLSKFLQLSNEEINAIYRQESIDAKCLLRWCKILNYDFFRLYSQHLIFFAPLSAIDAKPSKSKLSQFRKNIYTKEIIDFVLNQIRTGIKTKNEIIADYKIPKTTLYKWLKKYP